MITKPIHTEVICDIKYFNESTKYESQIYELINEVEKINSFVTGQPEHYVFSAYKNNVGAIDLLNILNSIVLSNIDNIIEFHIKIYRYDNSGKKIKPFKKH